MIVDHPAVTERHVTEREAVDGATFAGEIASGYTPVVLRGQVSHWAAVAAGRRGDRAMAEYLAAFGGGRPLEVMIGAPEIGGRFFYNGDLTGFNFHRQNVPLGSLVGELLRLSEQGVEAPHALYANAATAPEHLPGWEAANPLGLPTADAPARLWIGNATQVATHYDTSTNVACVVAGRRRFTLFPPEQLPNLYVGPLDQTIAGPPVSMVDLDAPDLDRYPRYAEALAHAEVAELGPGDALFIPALWWHHVRAFDRFNVLVNYWWEVQPATMPFLAMVHAIMSVRDLPAAERAAWRLWFDHYVFGDEASEAAMHLDPHARGILGPPNPARTERMRAFLLASLGGGKPQGRR